MTRCSTRFAFALGLVLAAAGLGLAQDIQLDVPYVPTRTAVVDEMLRLARVTKDDVVYDLGCGDGRLVIGAAQKYGARGVGFDIDPERIKECLENAQKAGVMDKVKFILGDLFEADFREATVMPMYLLTSVNLKLRPKILKELRPGARVVSHNFGMDNWRPDEQTIVRVEDVPHDVFLWIVPANISGTWIWTLVNGSAPQAYKIEIAQKFQHIEGRIMIDGAPAEMKDLKLRGDKVAFTVETKIGGKPAVLAFEGTAFLHQIAGMIKGKVDGKDVAYAWKAVRDPATETRIDDDPSWIY
ncbi:MAG: class I SAM-dependent methyltransferase [Candidatus Aminicenantes bacterium]|nr:class I SAM-dependent methyltransferase [Candidatus Aminicenantes bacterium]